MKTGIYYSILFLSTLLIGCTNKSDKTTEKEGEHEVLPPNTVEMNDAQCKAAEIELGKVDLKPLSNLLKVNGLINVPPQNLVSISAPMGGFVKNTVLVPGSPVKKGQVLAMLENIEFIELQQNYLESKNNLEYTEADYNRQKDLYKENVSSAKSFQQVVSEYKNLKTKVAALKQKLELIGININQLQEDKIVSAIPIISPLSGYVKNVNINIGKYVIPTDVMFEIVNNQKLTLELTLFEKDVNSIVIGQKVHFTMPDNKDREQSAVIYQVGKSISTENTIIAYATIDNEDKYLLPGMFVNAYIETNNNSVTALPSESVLTFDDKNYIFIFSEKKKEGDKIVTLFQMIEIKKGASSNGYTEIILPKNFDIEKIKVVLKGAYNLLSALKNAGDMAC